MVDEVNFDDAVADWEAGLLSSANLTPLSQSLIPADLASAFKIPPESPRTPVDVNRASESTISSLRPALSSSAAGSNFKPFGGGREQEDGPDPKRIHTDPVVDYPENLPSPSSAKTPKRPRLVWTPQLHRRFVDVVAHLGLNQAVPKTIMELMNVEGLSRENVASHLQMYRLYVKRMQGRFSTDGGPSVPSDHLSASTAGPQPPQGFTESSFGGELSHGSGFVNGSRGSNGGYNGMAYPHHHMPMKMMAYESGRPFT